MKFRLKFYMTHGIRYCEKWSPSFFFQYFRIRSSWLVITVDWELHVFNDTHREKLCFTQFRTRISWRRLAAAVLVHMFTPSVKFYIVTHQIDGKWTVVHFRKFHSKIWVGFCLNTGKCFFLEVSFSTQQKEHRFF